MDRSHIYSLVDLRLGRASPTPVTPAPPTVASTSAPHPDTPLSCLLVLSPIQAKLSHRRVWHRRWVPAPLILAMLTPQTSPSSGSSRQALPPGPLLGAGPSPPASSWPFLKAKRI